MDFLNKWNLLYAGKGLINLVVVYISEAHASDEWALSNVYTIPQHKSIPERIQVAKSYIELKNVNYADKIYVDSLNAPNFEKTYSSWPERGYIFVEDKIQFICYGKIEDLVRWGEEIDKWLEHSFN